MGTNEYTFLDTDLSLHRRSTDTPVRNAANDIVRSSKPTAMSAFSLLELKGNYIADLIFLYKKISSSADPLNLYNKIKNVGGSGRRVIRMLDQLWYIISENKYDMNPWDEARNELLTHLDSQINVAWVEFERSVDKIFDDFKCNRAHEEPEEDENGWSARISHCNKSNTDCDIVNFIQKYRTELEFLIDTLKALGDSNLTAELVRIKNIGMRTLTEGAFPWEANVCRKVGDLLIGLQSKSGKGLISSNRAEHGVLHEALGYNFREFPIAQLRSK